MSIYDGIESDDLGWIDRFRAKTGVGISSASVSVGADWIPNEQREKITSGKIYIITADNGDDFEVIGVELLGLSYSLIRGLDGTTPLDLPVESLIYQSLTAKQLEWIITQSTGGGGAGDIGDKYYAPTHHNIGIGHNEFQGFYGFDRGSSTGSLSNNQGPYDSVVYNSMHWGESEGELRFVVAPFDEVPEGKILRVTVGQEILTLNSQHWATITEDQFAALPKTFYSPVVIEVI